MDNPPITMASKKKLTKYKERALIGTIEAGHGTTGRPIAHDLDDGVVTKGLIGGAILEIAGSGPAGRTRPRASEPRRFS